MAVIVDPRSMLMLGGANCQSYDGDTSEQAWSERGALMAAHKRNAWVWNETTQAGRKIMLNVLGPSWKVWTIKNKTVAIAFDSDVWAYINPTSVSFNTAFGHGALLLPLYNKMTKAWIDVEAIHNTPKSVASNARKLSNLRKAGALSRNKPTVMAGDFALNSPSLLGWRRLTPKADSMDAKGTQTPDAAIGKKLVGFSNGALINPGRLSDHKWFKVDVTLVKNTPTN